MTLSESALNFATQAHKGQTRWDHKIPYITHPIEVSRIAIDLVSQQAYPWIRLTSDDYELIKAVSFCHDVAEDCEPYKNQEDKIADEVFSTGLEYPSLRFKFSSSIRILNKNWYDNYLDFIVSCRAFQGTRIIKIADIMHNLNDLKKTGSMKDKYLLALYILENE